MLEPGIAFLAWLLLLAIFIEAGNSEPGTISTGLPSLRVEAGRKRILFGELRAIDLQSVIANAAPIHPEAQTLVANELRGPNRLIYRRLLRFMGSEFVVQNQHEPVSLARFSPARIKSSILAVCV